MNRDEVLMFKDLRGYIEKKLGTEQWITVYENAEGEKEDAFFHCALLPEDKVADALKKYEWDDQIGNGMPGHTYYGATKETKYFRFGDDDGIEPLVIHRFFNGIREKYFEISEEFRHYHNLYEDKKTGNFFNFDNNGDEEEVIKIEKNKAQIKLKLIKQFLAEKKMCLALYFSISRSSGDTLESLGLKEDGQIFSGKDFVYEIFRKNWDGFSKKDTRKSFAQILGKKLIAGLADYKPNVWERKKKDYVEFIIGSDEEGNEIAYSSNHDELANYFGANPGAPNYLTPVFFKREVMNKYYSNPSKYSVEDGYIRCAGLWGIRIDNNHKDYVVVFLGDLGRDLPTKEQTYWKSFNVPPDGKMSAVNFKRSFLGEFTDPEQNDLLFKYRFRRFQEKWLAKYRWDLFKPLKPNDEHALQSLRVPLSDTQQEFDIQTASLTKIIVDSLNEKELAKNITLDSQDKGITKFSKFLKNKSFKEEPQTITFLRRLQDLRDGVAHRKGDYYKRGSKHFKVDDKNFIKAFDEILANSTKILDELERHFLI